MSEDLTTMIDEAVEDTFAAQETEPTTDEPQEKTPDETTKNTVEGEEKTEEIQEPEFSKEEIKRQRRQERLDKRFSTLTSQKYTLSNELEQYKAKFGDLAQMGDPKPVPENFKDEQQYHDQMIKWETTKELLEANQQKLADQKQETEFANFNKRVEAEKKDFPGFDEAMGAISELPMTAELHEVLCGSKNGTALLHFLAKNADIAETVVGMPPQKALFNLGKIEEKVASAMRAKKVKDNKSQAGAPVKSVKAKSAAQTDPEKMSMPEYAAWRAKNPIK